MTASTTVVEKIKKLLALSQNNPNEHEAQAAAAKVQELLTQHNLDMAEVNFSHQQSGPQVTVDTGKREKTAHTKSAMYKYQRDLMEALARNNFCKHWITKTWKKDPRGRKLSNGEGVRQVDTHFLLGREENVIATQMTYDYLTDTMDRLLPYTGMQKRGKEALLWLAGCTERLVERLNEQRSEKEREQVRTRTAPTASGSGSSSESSTALVVLKDVYATEEELNQDAKWGYEPGTTTRHRLEREARYLEHAAAEQDLIDKGHTRHEAYYLARGMDLPEECQAAAEKPETDAQRRKREDREQRDNDRRSDQYRRRQAKEREKKEHPAYREGKREGADIGLDTQVKDGLKGRIG